MSDIYFTEKTGKYRLDIPREGFTLNDPNSEFTEGFFVNWTYPINIHMTDDLKRTFGDLTDTNFVLNRKHDDGYINIEGRIHLCKIRFLNVKGTKLNIQFEFGIENLPSFDSPLSEFDFGKIETNNIYDFIDENLSKTYPDTNVYFPQVFTNKFREETKGNGFYFNDIYNDIELDIDDNMVIKRNTITDYGFVNLNILKPFIPLMHVLKTCFDRDGYELKGDILEDEDFKDAALNHSKEIFHKYEQDIKTTSIGVDETSNYYTAIENNTNLNALDFFKASNIVSKEHRIIGNYYLSIVTNKRYIVDLKATASWNDENGDEQNVELNYEETNGLVIAFEDGDLILTDLLPTFTEETKVKIHIKMTCLLHEEEGYGNQSKTVDVSLNPKRVCEDSPASQVYYQHDANISLNQCLPEITFGDVLRTLKNWKNYKLFPIGNAIYMNKIKQEITEKAIDIQFSEEKEPHIIFNKKDAYYLKMEVPEESINQEYTITRNQVLEENKPYNNRVDIIINGYPLPMKTLGDITTANEESEEISGLHLIKYKGLINGKNTCESLDSLNLNNIYEHYYKLRIKNRLEANTFKWSYIGDNKELKRLVSQNIVYAYQHNHKIINLQKKFIGKSSYKISFETENRF